MQLGRVEHPDLNVSLQVDLTLGQTLGRGQTIELLKPVNFVEYVEAAVCKPTRLQVLLALDSRGQQLKQGEKTRSSRQTLFLSDGRH